MLWKERSRIRAIQMDNLRGLRGVRRKDRILNAWIRELCGLRNLFSSNSVVMWRGWRIIGLLRESMLESVLGVAQWVAMEEWIDTVKDSFK